MNLYLRSVPYCLLLLWVLNFVYDGVPSTVDPPIEQPLHPDSQQDLTKQSVEREATGDDDAKAPFNNTGPWAGVKQGNWLHGPCPVKMLTMQDSATARTGTIEVYPWDANSLPATITRLGLLHANVTKADSCWGSDLMMVCSSCCDGVMKSCAGHYDVKKWNRRFRRQLGKPWTAALYKGEFHSVDYSYVPRTGLRLSGLPASDDRNLITSANCTEFRDVPLLIMKNGDWTRGTSMNVAHWLGEIMGVILGAVHHYNVKKVQLLIPNCPITRPGPTKLCKTYPVFNDHAGEVNHLRASPFGDGTQWVFALAKKLGVSWIRDSVTHADIDPNKVTCFKKVVWGCPGPRACPTPKYLSTIMPLYQYFLSSKYNMVYNVPLGKEKKRLTLLTRKPGGSRFITNSVELLEVAEKLKWEAEGLPVWKSEEVGYQRMAAAFQGSNVVASMHGADLAFAQVLMRRHTVAIEILLEHAIREDPFYVFQGHGAGLTVLRWAVSAASVPEWNAETIESQFNGTIKYNNNISWRRKAIPFTLPLHSWKVVLQTAELLI